MVARFESKLAVVFEPRLDPTRGGASLYPVTVGPLDIQFETRRISASNPISCLVYTFSFGFLMTLISFVYLRNQLRPIKRSGPRGRSFGTGATCCHIRTGAVGVRAAGAAFVDMRAADRAADRTADLECCSGVSPRLAHAAHARMRLGLAM